MHARALAEQDAANVEPAPEIVEDPELEEVVVAVLAEPPDDVELLPQAASPSTSTATPASAPIWFLITTFSSGWFAK